jgi:hypothetical protein
LALVRYALGKPGRTKIIRGARSWTKVGKKVFVFFGVSESRRCRDERQAAGIAAAGAGAAWRELDRIWVGQGRLGLPSVSGKPIYRPETLREWIDESYRAVAPKRIQKPLIFPRIGSPPTLTAEWKRRLHSSRPTGR